MSLSKRLVQRCMAAMQAEYGRRWNCKTRPYPGVPQMLDQVERAGLPKAVFSNKPDAFTHLAVAEFLGGWLFHPIRGAKFLKAQLRMLVKIAPELDKLFLELFHLPRDLHRDPSS